MATNIGDPHTKEIEELILEAKSGHHGLTDAEAALRLEACGPNELPETNVVSPFLIALKQFKSWLVIVLLIAALISALAGQIIDMWVIIVVVVVNAAIGFTQEYRAEKAIAALQKMLVKTAKVFRNGTLRSIAAKNLVPGDVIVLEEGDSIPADGRIAEAKNLRTIEASLTGESLPITKHTNVLEKNTALADQKNMVRSGTFVAGGYGRVLVTGTGPNTAIGEISQTMGDIAETKTSFMKKTDILARQMSVIAIVSASLIFLAGYFLRHYEINEILLTSIAALVAAVPEGLPAVISIVLAVGAHRMAKRNAIIREFTATEALGAVTCILTDKTGTLTQNTLTCRTVYLPGEDEIAITGEGWFPAGNFKQREAIIDAEANPVLQKLLKIAAVSNNSEIRHDTREDQHELLGDPTEGALNVLARKGGIKKADFKGLITDDLPFDSELRLRATLVEEGQNTELYVTGAPEELLELSSHVLKDGKMVELTPEAREDIQDKIAEWSGKAMRVIALAYRQQQGDKIDRDNITNLVLTGIVGMIDPPRKDAKEAVEKCKRAGIRVVMVTGDHLNTAVAIAKDTGIINDGNETVVRTLTEWQLNQLDEDELDEAIRHVSVFARVTPKMKLKIAERLQAQGHLVAMTGDGVNDAPALKKADVGVSMGIMGTDVARNASDVVLADDNFATIVNAVEEGRIVFTNARQTSFFLVTTNIAESVTLLVSIAIGFPLPLTATQLLWLNLVTDGVTDMSLAMESGHGNIMKAQPMKKEENILNYRILPFLFINVLLMAGLALGAFHYYSAQSTALARTGAFVVMAFTQLFNVYNLRSIDTSVFKIGVFSNKYLNIGVAASAALLIAVTEIDTLAAIFHFQSLNLTDFLVLFALSSSVLWAGEVFKGVRNGGMGRG